MELFDLKDEKLQKIDTQSNNVLTEEELSMVNGGYAVVSDPIYSLTSKESQALSQAGYKLKKTNSGNYRITDENNKMVSPSEVETLCKVINKCSKQQSNGRTFWDWLSGN